MFSIKCLELVKVLHEIDIGYQPTYDPYDSWENNVGECKALFYGVCSYDEFGQPIPCVGCYRFY